jgi:nitroimidazol reductase NimA-like FMN-containing flavoprotein (pyridoxamine 5'-phosphate oxidase superfamily)
MVTTDTDPLAANRMADEEVDVVLERAGVGVLSLARDAEAYGVPVSFGFDGADRVYFVFVGFGPGSRKEAFAEATRRASFAVYEVSDVDDWRSVLVEGPIERTTDWAAARATFEDNAWYPSLFREADPMRSLDVWTLRVEAKSGLRADRHGDRAKE